MRRRQLIRGNDVTTREGNQMTISSRTNLRGAVALLAGVTALLGCLFAGAGTAAAITPPGFVGGPKWEISYATLPTNFKAGEEEDTLLALATNVGGTPSSGATTVTVELPAEVTYANAEIRREFSSLGSCELSGSTVTCTTSEAINPGEQAVVPIVVNVSAGAGGVLASQAAVSGGGAAAGNTASISIPVSEEAAAPGIAPGSFSSDTSTTQAGAHANASVGFSLITNRRRESSGTEVVEPAGALRDIIVDTPPGLIGSAAAAPKCNFSQFSSGTCPASTIVGLENLQMGIGAVGPGSAPYVFGLPLYNLTAPDGVPAEFGFKVLTISVILRAKVRSGGDYGLTISGGPNSEAAAIYGSQTMFYGVPSEHNGSGTAPTPFITNPTACGSPLTSSLGTTFYQQPGAPPATATSAPTTWTGCDQVPFAPSIGVSPQTHQADSPTGLDVDVHVPQSEDAEGLSSAALKEAVVQLPEGLTVNPASADGLGACSEAQIALDSSAPASCPDSAKIGSVEIDTPLLDHPMPGSVYLAQPHANPFGTLLAMYLAVYDPVSGITLKIPGRIDADPTTGRLTATVTESPQLPFEDARLHFFGGPRASLKTPQGCGSFTTTADLTPWSTPEGADAHVQDSFAVSSGAGGAACSSGEAGEPNSPSFEAGTVFTNAGSDSPLVLRLSRPDGSQRLGALNVTLPEGLLARLKGVPYCPDAAIAAAAGRSGSDELSAPSCPAASQVGQVTVGVGAGSQPYHVQGRAYLAGPYKGAPLSLAFITPAVAGPFDLGTVVVRSALQIDPVTTQVAVKSDPLPSILQGIPLDVRSLVVEMNRAGFTRNPTSCEVSAFGGEALSLLGGAAPIADRFQVGGCRGLAFKPKLSLSLSGAAHRSGHPKLRAVLKARPGEADIARAQVTLPPTEFLEQSHIRTICTRVQYAEDNCPKASIYGYAKAYTPLLDDPLEGPVYLRSSNHTLPDLVASLDGQIHVDLAGRIDSVHSRMRTTFWAVPDAPVTKFVLTMQGGKKGLLVNNAELCDRSPRASAEFHGHNGKVSDSNPVVKVACGSDGSARK
ncbi:MAG: hypothetical protein ACM3Q9_00390 [Methanosarcina sp.]